MKPKKLNLIIFIFYCFSLVLGVIYGSSWIGLYDLNHEQSVVHITQFTEQKPYVYRVFVPLLARALSEGISIPPDYAIFILMVIAYVSMFWSLQYLGKTFSDDRLWVTVLSFAGVLATVSILMIKARKIYDPVTVFFFAFSLSLLARGKFWEYYIIFPLATLNRETTFILTGFFAVYFFNKIPLRNYLFSLTYQIVTYIIVKYSLETIFVSNGGKSFFLFDYHVIQTYLANPPLALLILLIFCLIVVAALWNPSNKPAFLKVAFLCIFPTQIFLHIILGYPYEFRVFLESLPVIFALLISTRPKSDGNRQQTHPTVGMCPERVEHK